MIWGSIPITVPRTLWVSELWSRSQHPGARRLEGLVRSDALEESHPEKLSGSGFRAYRVEGFGFRAYRV